MTALSQFAHKSPKLSGSHQTEPVPKKKHEHEFRLSLERLDKVVKEMIIPLEF
jgi:hypothetical protein